MEQTRRQLNVYSNDTQNWTDLIRILMPVFLGEENWMAEGLAQKKKKIQKPKVERKGPKKVIF